MAWNGLALTVDGQNALNAAQLANSMEIRSVVVGDGRPPANFRTLKGLVHQLYEVTDLRIDMAEDGKCTITVDIPKVGYDYYFREIGIIVMTNEGEKLYVYDNCGDDAQYIVSTTGVEATRKRIRLTLNISDVAEIAVTNPSILYVAYDDFEETKERLERGIKSNAENLDGHIEDYNNPHKVTPEQLGLDSTSDMDKPVSIAQQAALDALYEQLVAYTRQKIADLINGAPESLDTLKEVADTIAAHKTVMDALDAAIGKKASAAEFDSHTKDATKHITTAERTKWNAKMETTGDSANNTTTFTSGDATNPTGWADIGLVASGEKHNSLMRKFSLAIKNVRYLWKLLGSTSLSGIGDGTVTGAINALNTGIIKIKFATASAASTRTLTEIGIITSSGNYIVFLQTHTNNNNAGSAYLIRYVNAVYLISPIIEGGNENAPRITLSGVLRLNTQTEQRTVSCGILGL
nr:hypothetical protein [uncultured Acetatifactor sp.]